MRRYRRVAVGGGTYFFTVETYRRQRLLTDEDPQRWLREAIVATRTNHPFETDA